jgi:hypothetical protein
VVDRQTGLNNTRRVTRTHFLGNEEVGADDDDLARNVPYPDVLERLGVVERDLAGHCI